jgi:nanoRNase/pAp phosphatase (c-di-AMP/oligoRNAs hydrolase)
LDIGLRRFDPEEDPTETYGALALVDHSRPGVNDQLDPDTQIAVVLDHHPSEGVEAEFIDLREDVGATSTLLVEYVSHFGLVEDWTVATALLYGIRVDTNDFTRETSRADFEAAAALLPYADGEVLERVESPSVSPETLETIAGAIENRELDGSALATCVGSITDRDALAQAADRLLAMEGVATTFVYGYTDDTIYVSARSQGGVDLGAVLRDAFDGIGSAGGHADMAGAQIPLGVFSDMGEDAAGSLRSAVADAVTPRFFEALRA